MIRVYFDKNNDFSNCKLGVRTRTIKSKGGMCHLTDDRAHITSPNYYFLFAIIVATGVMMMTWL